MIRLPKLGDIVRLTKYHSFMCVREPVQEDMDELRAHGRVMWVFWFEDKTVKRFWFSIHEPHAWELVSEVE